MMLPPDVIVISTAAMNSMARLIGDGVTHTIRQAKTERAQPRVYTKHDAVNK